MTEEPKKQPNVDEIIKTALEEAVCIRMERTVRDAKFDEPLPAYSVDHRRRMNRIFRVYAGFTHAYYPEVDTPWRRLADRVEFHVRRAWDRLFTKK